MHDRYPTGTSKLKKNIESNQTKELTMDIVQKKRKRTNNVLKCTISPAFPQNAFFIIFLILYRWGFIEAKPSALNGNHERGMTWREG
jgi:hypothetical protein